MICRVYSDRNIVAYYRNKVRKNLSSALFLIVFLNQVVVLVVYVEIQDDRVFRELFSRHAGRTRPAERSYESVILNIHLVVVPRIPGNIPERCRPVEVARRRCTKTPGHWTNRLDRESSERTPAKPESPGSRVPRRIPWRRA